MQTIGERLEEARKKKGISIREAAEATKIRGDYLQKFESNQFDIGLTEIYARGFLRSYANFLRLPSDRIISDYAALGRGDTKPRQPSREVYGRMDITVASVGEAGDRGAPPAGEAPKPDAAAGNAPAQPRYPRGSGPTLPSGPDPALVFRYVKIGLIAVVVILVVVVIKALFSGADTPATPAPSMSAEPVLTLVASDAVKVTVVRKHAGQDEVLFDGVLTKGQTRTIPRPSALNITASAAENLTFEINGRRIPMSQSLGGLTGFQTGVLPAP